MSHERRIDQRIDHIVLRDAAGIEYPFALRNFSLEVAIDDELTVVWARQTELGTNSWPLAVRRESTGVVFYSPGLAGLFLSVPDLLRMGVRIALCGALLGAVVMTVLGPAIASTIWALGMLIAPAAYMGISAARVPGRLSELKAQLFR